MTTFARLAKILSGEVAPKNWIEQAFKGVVDAIATAVAGNVPAVGAEDKGKFLHSDAETGAVEWASVSEVPAVTNNDKGKFLLASYGTGDIVWGSVRQTPIVGTNDKDKYLHTNPISGTMEWVTIPLPLLVTLTATGGEPPETLTADQFFSQINAAFNAGEPVYVHYSGYYSGNNPIRLTPVERVYDEREESTTIYFSCMTGTSGPVYATVNNDDEWNVYN